MDSDTTETVNNDSESSSSAQEVVTDDQVETPNEESVWDRVQRLTYDGNIDYWSNLLSTDPSYFRLRFKDSFIESCRTWLTTINDFVENDETWNALMDTKSNLFQELPEDDEALLSAIDKRKYKLLKRIDWEQLEADLLGDSTDESTTEEEIVLP